MLVDTTGDTLDVLCMSDGSVDGKSKIESSEVRETPSALAHFRRLGACGFRTLSHWLVLLSFSIMVHCFRYIINMLCA